MSEAEDPMLSRDATEQARYSDSVMEKMRAAMEEDRADRRKAARKPDSAATLIGGTGALDVVIQAL